MAGAHKTAPATPEGVVEPGAVAALGWMGAYLPTLTAVEVTMDTERDDVDDCGLATTAIVGSMHGICRLIVGFTDNTTNIVAMYTMIHAMRVTTSPMRSSSSRRRRRKGRSIRLRQPRSPLPQAPRPLP